MISKRQFLKLKPYERGYAVYMAGERDDEPNVPNEQNPYRHGSNNAAEWERGQQQAVLDVQDSEE